MSVTWGNITNKDVTGDSYTAIYPKSMATIGRAAYTQDSYDLVRQYMTNSQMAAPPSTTIKIVPGDTGTADSPSYYVYNAVSGTGTYNVQVTITDKDGGTYVVDGVRVVA